MVFCERLTVAMLSIVDWEADGYCNGQSTTLAEHLTSAEASGVNLPIWSSVRLTVVRWSIVDWKGGGTEWSFNNSGCTITYKMGG